MQFIDLKTQQSRIRQKLETRVLQVFDHGQYIMGPEVKELEQKLADFVGVPHCINGMGDRQWAMGDGFKNG